MPNKLKPLSKEKLNTKISQPCCVSQVQEYLSVVIGRLSSWKWKTKPHMGRVTCPVCQHKLATDTLTSHPPIMFYRAGATRHEKTEEWKNESLKVSLLGLPNWNWLQGSRGFKTCRLSRSGEERNLPFFFFVIYQCSSPKSTNTGLPRCTSPGNSAHLALSIWIWERLKLSTSTNTSYSFSSSAWFDSYNTHWKQIMT